MEEWDVVVVGAGPTGSNAARLLSQRGWRVLLLEEHPVVGHPVQCAGLVTPRTFDHTPFPVGDLLQSELRGARVVAPDGTAVTFETAAVQAQAMDRARFDQRMAEHAVAAGAVLRTSAKAIGAARDDSGVFVDLLVQGKPATVWTRLLVGADGIRGGVARWFGFPSVREIVSCYEAELSGCRIPAGEPHLIPMYAGAKQAPGFFSWIIPVGGDKARAGLAVAPGMNLQSAKAYYEAMFDEPGSRDVLKGAKEGYLIIGGIPLGLRDSLVQDRVMLVGDAAGMAKPTSGGGIYYGLVASEFLAATAHRALAGDRLDRGSLMPYERRVRRVLGRELRKGWALRSLYKRFTDDDFNALARLLSTPRCRRAIERHGDIDYPSRLVGPLLWAQPRLATLFLRILHRPDARPPTVEPSAGSAPSHGHSPEAHA